MNLVKAAFLAVTLTSALSSRADTAIKAGTYKIDPAHSRVGFEIPHMVISTVEGRFNAVDGEIVLKDKIEKSSVKATVEINSLDTANAKRDEHLKSPDFFDAAKFGKMTFVSKSITGSAPNFKVNGDLTIKGVTKAVSFDTKYLGEVSDPMMNADRAAFTGTTTIKRADYGLTWNKMIEAGPIVGDTVTILLKIEATKPGKGKPKA